MLKALQAGKNVFVEKPHGIDPYGVKMPRKAYESELRALQIELLKMQAHVQAAGERLVVIGRPVFAQLPDAAAAHFFVVGERLAAALELPADRFLLVHEKHHDVNGRLPKMDAQG